MSIYVVIACGACREPFEGHFPLGSTSAAAIRTYVAARGWRLGVPWRSQEIDLCPECVRLGRDTPLRSRRSEDA